MKLDEKATVALYDSAISSRNCRATFGRRAAEPQFADMELDTVGCRTLC
jgi:hypothetical protein